MHRNLLQVFWIDARAIPARVIKRLLHSTVNGFIDHAVRHYTPPTDSHLPITVMSFPTAPDPAAVFIWSDLTYVSQRLRRSQ